MIKLKSATFNLPVRILNTGASSLNTHCSNDRFDIVLFEYTHIEIRQKGTSTVLAIVPFTSAVFVIPEEAEKFDDLETADVGDEGEGLDLEPLVDVKPKLKSKKTTHARP